MASPDRRDVLIKSSWPYFASELASPTRTQCCIALRGFARSYLIQIAFFISGKRTFIAQNIIEKKD